MGNLFNPDNRVFTILSKVFDMVFISFVFLLFCIPVITIGPACTALYYSVVKVIRRERSYLFREFFKSFKLNFKRGAITGIVLTVVYAVLAVDLVTTYQTMDGQLYKQILFGIYIAFSVIALGFSVYVFPVLSRFDLTIKQLIKTVFFMTSKHFPSTLLMIILLIASVVSVIMIPILAFIVPALLTLINSFFIERILKKYITKDEDSKEDKKDEWYLE